MNKFSKTNPRPLCRAESGYTLIELMISVVIGLFLIGGLVTLLVTNSVNSAELNKTGAQIENGRYAMQLLFEDVQHAGYLGTYSPPKTTAYTAPDPCDTTLPLGFAATAIPNLPVPIYGYDGAAASPSCIANRKAGTDIVVVRRVSTTPIAVASSVANEVYFQVLNCSTPAGLPDFVINTKSGSPFPLTKRDCLSTNPENIQKFMVHIYFVSSCNVCSPSDTIPTLKVAEFVGGAFVITPLVEGIENLQVEYGLDTNIDGAPDCFTSNPTVVPVAEVAACPTAATYFATATAVKNWSNVVAARIHVLARNVEATAGWVDNRTYNLGLDASIAPTNDPYKRHVYAATARLYNPSGQREAP